MTLEFKPAPVDIPDAVLDDLRDASRADEVPQPGRRRRLGDGHRAGVPPDVARVLERPVRLARARGPLQRVRADRHRSRRPAHPLPARALTGARRAAAPALARLARVGHRVPRRARSALEPERPRRRSRRRVPRGRAVASGLRLLRSHARTRLAPASDGAGVHAGDGRPRLRPLRRAGRRLGFDRVAERGRPRPRARVRPAPQLHQRAATEGRARPDAE